MKLNRLLLAAITALVVSCSKPPASEEAQSAPPPAAPAVTASSEPAPAAPAPAPAPAIENASPAAVEPPAEGAETVAPVPSLPAPMTPSNLKEGVDYVLIANGTPLDTPADQIEVAEMFNYACPACNAFAPMFAKWKATLPEDVHVVYVPMDFRADFVQYAHAYYAAESLGLVEKSHEAVFEAIHKTRTLPGEGQKQESAEVAAFYAQFGADAKEFQKLMDSFAINARTTKARQYAIRSKVNSTPSLLIDGKYLLKGNSWDDWLRIADELIAQIRAQKTP